MDKQRIFEIARQSMGTRKGLLTREVGNLLHHGQRVAALALNLHEQVDANNTIDQDVLYTAGLFHDIGKGINPHAETGAELAKSLLQEACSPDDCAQVVELIRLHNKRGRSDLPLAAHILQDADVLDHIGAQSIWLCFAFNAYTERGPNGALAYYTGAENQHIQPLWRAMLNLEISRKVFDQRLAVEQQFMQRFGEEMAGEF